MEKSTRFVTYLATVLQFRVSYENYSLRLCSGTKSCCQKELSYRKFKLVTLSHSLTNVLKENSYLCNNISYFLVSYLSLLIVARYR